MVNNKPEMNDDTLHITNENSDENDLELEAIEEKTGDKLKQLRQKIVGLEAEKKQLQDDLQRAKAEFLNARKRLEEDRERDQLRNRIRHVESLLPLCDSFQMAMHNKETWEKADAAWRKGVEGIHGQLLQLLKQYHVETIAPIGEPFDHHRHEAVGSEPVDDATKQDTVISVIQLGYELRHGGTTELIRPARVIIGTVGAHD